MSRLALLLVLLAGCSSPESIPQTMTTSTTLPATSTATTSTTMPATSTTTTSTTMPTTSTTATSTPTTTTLDSGDLGDVSVATVSVDGRELTVAVVSTAEDRSQGLRGVTDLGELDGMLFTWGGETVASRFTMAETVITLDIAFFDADGEFVDGFTMVPCEETPCPSYVAAGPYAFALESPAGALPDIGPGSVLVLPG